jgi:hypothetical protein
VTFKPTGINARTASLSITVSAPGSPQAISLSGVGTIVELNPDSLRFLYVPFGQHRSGSITLTNVGSTTLSINSITYHGSTGVFSTTHTCGPSLEARTSCTITVTLKAGPPGVYTLDIYVSDNGGASPQDVHVIGWICAVSGCHD